MISREDIARVKEVAHIEDIISDSGVALRPAGGGSFKGLCPFHDEKTPSFTVKGDYGYWKCFGCQKSGDVFGYIQEHEGMTFAESVRWVAERYNVEIVEDNSEGDDSNVRRSVFQVNTAAAEFFNQRFRELTDSHPARVELANRDLHLQAAASRVGWAPAGWSNLVDHLRGLGFDEQSMLDAGVANINEESGRVYDAFRGRLTWEIRDIQGRVIGFGARRVLDDDKGAKYLNTRETVVYKKSQVLYGLDMARQVAAREKRMIIVEGYTDVMAFHAAGVFNVVASCGTAFGESHANIVRRIITESGVFVFCFDGDNAGLSAARKVFDLQAPIQNNSVAVAFEGGDPCDVRKASGNSGLISQLDNTKPLTEFVLRHEMAKFDVKGSAEGKSGYFKEITPILLGIKDRVAREEYVRKVTLWTGVTLEAAKESLRHNASLLGNTSGGRAYEHVHSTSDTPHSDARVSKEKQLLALVVQYPTAARKLLREVRSIDFSARAKDVAGQILADIESTGRVRSETMDSNPIVSSLLMVPFPLIEGSRDPDEAAETVIHSTVEMLDTMRRKEAHAALVARISEVSGASEEMDMELLERFMEAQKGL